MTWLSPHRHMTCHHTTYATQNKECTSQNGTIQRVSPGGQFSTLISLFFNYLF